MPRPANHAGTWYPADPNDLRTLLTGFMEGDGVPKPAIGLVSPHAGYKYSGAVAGQGFAAVEIPPSAIVLAPAHRGSPAVAVWDGDDWDTPFGSIAIDDDLRQLVLDNCPSAEPNSAAHRAEHSIELQLPFLKLIRDDVRILPILISTYDTSVLEELGKACAKAVETTADPKPLIVASSDMTHFESAAAAKSKDDLAIEKIRTLDPKGLIEVVRGHSISMCGAAPTAAMLYAANGLGASAAEVVSYATSGDVTGDQTDVVAYLAMAVRSG